MYLNICVFLPYFVSLKYYELMYIDLIFALNEDGIEIFSIKKSIEMVLQIIIAKAIHYKSSFEIADIFLTELPPIIDTLIVRYI